MENLTVTHTVQYIHFTVWAILSAAVYRFALPREIDNPEIQL